MGGPFKLNSLHVNYSIEVVVLDENKCPSSLPPQVIAFKAKKKGDRKY